MQRRPVHILLTLIGLFIGGSVAGGLLGWRLDPRAPICRILGSCALPIALFACLASWYGRRFLMMGAAYLKLPFGRPVAGDLKIDPELESADDEFIPATMLFIPICGLIGAGFGFVIAYCSTALYVSSFFGMGLLGAGYGWLIHTAANSGLLLAPERAEM